MRDCHWKVYAVTGLTVCNMPVNSAGVSPLQIVWSFCIVLFVIVGQLRFGVQDALMLLVIPNVAHTSVNPKPLEISAALGASSATITR